MKRKKQDWNDPNWVTRKEPLVIKKHRHRYDRCKLNKSGEPCRSVDYLRCHCDGRIYCKCGARKP